MEYGRKCFAGEGLEIMKRKSWKCRVAIISFSIILVLLLTLVVAAYSYAAETLTLEQAIDTALDKNPALEAADSQIEVADAGVLRSTSGFLPKVTLSETWSRTDNPLMAGVRPPHARSAP